MSEMPSWEAKLGHCGSCTQFKKDFGGSTNKVYGHCSVKPRSGAITSADFKCDVYTPIPAVAGGGNEPPKVWPKRDPFAETGDTFARPPEPQRKPAQAPVLVRRPIAEIPDDDDDDLDVTPSQPVRTAPRMERDLDATSGEEIGTLTRAQFKRLLREAIDETLGLSKVEMMDRFRGGNVVVQPGDGQSQARTLPIDGLFHKIVMVRDNLRVLEQKVNATTSLDDAERVQLQQYVTRCYGSLTTFNFLFKHRDDWFRGAGKDE